jgi:hypothetical protein
LHDISPRYLADKVQNPIPDLGVADKFTGEAAFCCALADGEMISAAIAAAAQSQWRKWRHISVEMF